MRHTLLTALLLAATIALGGCATSRMIDSDVHSFSGQPPARTGASFAIEHLPSQQGQSDVQSTIDAQLTQALENVGLHAGNNPDYLAQIQVDVSTIRNPYWRPPRRSKRVLADGTVIFEPVMEIEIPWYRHQVQVLLRDTHSNTLAYQAQADFDGPWRDTLNLLPAMLQAALRDYPNALQGKVVVELKPPSP